MNNIITTAIASALIITASAASASSFVSTGVIESINTASNTVQIQSGDAYSFSDNVDLGNFQAGERVNIDWNSQNPSRVGYGSSSERTVQLLEANSVRHAN